MFPRKKIVGLGVATLDHLITVPAFPVEDIKIHCEMSEIQGGGNAANTLVGLSRLGLDTQLLSRIGIDEYGNQIIKSIEREGVHIYPINYPFLKTNDSSAVSYILINRATNSRTVIHQQGQSYDVEIPFGNDILEGTDGIYLDGRFHKPAKRLAMLAKQKNVPVFAEAERLGLHAEELFPYADVVFTSENFPEAYSGTSLEEGVELILQQGPKMVVTTLGEKGARLQTRDEIITTPKFNAIVVDTTGAGDAFNAGFIYGYFQDWEARSILRFGSKIAALKCEKIGARAGLPYEHQIESIRLELQI